MDTREIFLYLSFVLPVTIGWITSYIRRKMWHGTIGTIIGVSQLILLIGFSDYIF